MHCVCPSVLTLLTVYNEINSCKRSERLKFSTGFIHKNEGQQIHLQASFAVTFSGAQKKFPPLCTMDITQTALWIAYTLNPHLPQVHTAVSQTSTVITRLKIKKFSKVSRTFQKVLEASCRSEVDWQTMGLTSAMGEKKNSYHWKWTNHKTSRICNKEFK